MQSISELTNLHGKKVILRLDLNVPLNNGEITDTTRIDKVLPTIEFLLKQNSKIVILSHVGRPKGKVIRDLSLKPIQGDIILFPSSLFHGTIPANLDSDRISLAFDIKPMYRF